MNKNKMCLFYMNKKHIKTNSHEFFYYDIIFKINEIHPLIELKREELIENIRLTFSLIFGRYTGPSSYYSKYGKTIIRTTDEIISKFIMFLLSKNNKDDPVIPTNIVNLDVLEKELRSIISPIRSFTDEQKDYAISQIIKKCNKKLIPLFRESYDTLLKYYNSDIFNIAKNDKEIIITRINNDVTLYYRNNPVFINYKLYNKILNRFPSNFDSKNMYIWCLCKRYIMLSSFNNQLAVHPKTMNKLYTDFNTRFELFGSVLNTYNTSYCSMFYDIEKIFGSYGSFFDMEIISGNYSVNPPFDNEIIFQTMNILENTLKSQKNDLMFIIWIPIWDDEGKFNFVLKKCLNDNRTREELEEHHIKIFGTKKPQKELEYYGLNIILNSKYNKYIRPICSGDMTYINYMNNNPKYVANTYMITFSNTTINQSLIDNLTVKHNK